MVKRLVLPFALAASTTCFQTRPEEARVALIPFCHPLPLCYGWASASRTPSAALAALTAHVLCKCLAFALMPGWEPDAWLEGPSLHFITKHQVGAHCQLPIVSTKWVLNGSDKTGYKRIA